MRTFVAASAAKWKINSRRSAGLYVAMSVNQENKRGVKRKRNTKGYDHQVSEKTRNR